MFNQVWSKLGRLKSPISNKSDFGFDEIEFKSFKNI